MTRARWCVLTAALFCLPSLALAELYRYVDEHGQTVLDDNIPPRYATQGYVVLSNDGRVLRQVERQLTPEEVAEQEALAALQQEQNRAAKVQLATDTELLRRYSSPEDVERAMERRLASIDALINTTRGNIQRLRIQRRNLEAEAAERERSGRTVSQELIENIRIIEIQLREREEHITDRLAEQEEVKAAYTADMRRLDQLLASGARR